MTHGRSPPMRARAPLQPVSELYHEKKNAQGSPQGSTHGRLARRRRQNVIRHYDTNRHSSRSKGQHDHNKTKHALAPPQLSLYQSLTVFTRLHEHLAREDECAHGARAPAAIQHLPWSRLRRTQSRLLPDHNSRTNGRTRYSRQRAATLNRQANMHASTGAAVGLRYQNGRCSSPGTNHKAVSRKTST